MGDARDQPGGRRGDAGEMAEEVQRHPLAGQNGAGIAVDAGDDITDGKRRAIVLQRFEMEGRVAFAESAAGQRQAGEHARLARDERGPRRRIGGDRRRRGDVAGAAEVLPQRGADGVLDEETGKVGKLYMHRCQSASPTARSPIFSATMTR